MPQSSLPISRAGKEALIFEGVTILTEGSATLGFGHIRRSLTLARLLTDRSSVRLWVVCDGPEESEPMREHFRGLEVGAGPEPDFESRVEILDLEPEAMRRHLMRPAASAKRLCLDWFDPALLPDMTMNLIDHSGQMRTAYSNSRRAESYVEGPQCAIIRPGLRALRPETPAFIPEVRNVVITAGGADPARRTLDALSDLRNHASESVKTTVIIGPLVPAGYEAEIRGAAQPSMTLLRAPEDYDAILSRADVVLCSGGGTLLESMCLGKVAVVYPQTPAEENHARFHAAAGACVMRESMPEVMRDATLRNSLVAKAHRQVDGRGAERIAEAAMWLLRQV